MVSQWNTCINPLHPYISIRILHTVLYNISFGTDKENFFNNQNLIG